MPICPATKANGSPCGKNGTAFEGHCGTHHNSKLRTDPVYRQRFEAHQAGAQAAQQQIAAMVAEGQAAEAARVAARREAAAARQQREREAIAAGRVAKRERDLTACAEYSVSKVVSAVRALVEMWSGSHIEGDDCVKAYAVLRYMSMRHDGFTGLLRAVVFMTYMRDGYYPNVERYADIPAAEREAAFQGIRDALGPYGEVNYRTLVPNSDNLIWPEIRRREAEVRRREEERLRLEAAAAAEARRLQFQADLRERPVIFQRDPEGGINLAAFATDAQNIHRSSVQTATHKMVLAVMKRPKAEEDVTLVEICEDFRTPSIVRWSNDEARDRAILEFERDYNELEAFAVRYGTVVDHVWAFIREHVHRKDITIRLAQEIWEGRGMCSNGKMARLMNVLQGYDDTLEMEPPRELFHGRIAEVAKLPLTERAAAAAAVFSEFRIPAEEHEVWLEPLMEA